MNFHNFLVSSSNSDLNSDTRVKGKVLINFLVCYDLFFRKRSFYSKGFIFEEKVRDFKF